MQEIWAQFWGQEDPLEKEMAIPLQYSCLGNPMDRGARQAAVNGVAKVLDTAERLNNNILHSTQNTLLITESSKGQHCSKNYR